MGEINISRIRKLSLTKHIEWGSPLGEYLMDSFVLGTKPPNRSMILVEPTTKRYSVIGHAFDHIIDMQLDCEGAIQFSPKSELIGLLSITQDHDLGTDVLCDLETPVLGSSVLEENQCECRRCYHYNEFVLLWNRWLVCKETVDTRFMAQFALSLGLLTIFKITGRYFSEKWFAPPVNDSEIDEMIELLTIWKANFRMPEGKVYSKFKFQKPHFGFADTDLICGAQVIDWKVKTNPRKKLREDVAQMIGLCACARMNEISVDSFSLYYARHGFQFTLKLEEILKDGVDVVAGEIASALEYMQDRILERERAGEMFTLYY